MLLSRLAPEKMMVLSYVLNFLFPLDGSLGKTNCRVARLSCAEPHLREFGNRSFEAEEPGRLQSVGWQRVGYN